MDIAIVDDIEQDRLRMHQLILGWGKQQSKEINISLFNSGDSLLDNLTFERFSIVLLDLYMNGTNGMDTAREMRRRGYTGQIVFITSSIAYATQGYEVDAANYLLKPVESSDLYQALNHCLARLGGQSAAITVTCNRSSISIPLNKIVWIEAQRNALLFHTDGGLIKSYMTLEALSKMLEGHEQFLLCCKGVLVNMNRIATVGENDFIMDNDEHVQIRKRGASQVKRDYLHYLFAQGQG